MPTSRSLINLFQRGLIVLLNLTWNGTTPLRLCFSMSMIRMRFWQIRPSPGTTMAFIPLRVTPYSKRGQALSHVNHVSHGLLIVDALANMGEHFNHLLEAG